ncbi:MAG TPA: cytochrome P450 [Gemmataceae bacterium]|nr:cytochrome P450 [Gemmataceae bacterium]
MEKVNRKEELTTESSGFLFGPEPLANPYPVYHRLRSFSPVYWAEKLNGWVVTSYDAVNTVARSPQVSNRGKSHVTQQRITDFRTQLLLLPLSRNILSTDPPDHTRLRSLVSKAFSPGAVEAMRPRIQYLVDEYFDQAQRQGGMDVIAELGRPLPIRVIAEMLGFPREDNERFGDWSDAVSVVNDWVGAITPEQIQTIGKTLTEFNAYLRPLIEQRRAQPRNDLLSAMVRAEEAGDRLSEAELYSNTLMLLATGHETTTNLIGNGTLALLRHPDQYRMLCDNQALVPQAVEELLRYDCSVQIGVRKATEDFDIGGATIRAGQLIFLIWGAANRDPAQFPDPDRLDVTRSDNKHVAFGVGIHYCLGAAIARLEAQIVFSTLARRFPQMRLATEQLEYRNNHNLRGLKFLPVTL